MNNISKIKYSSLLPRFLSTSNFSPRFEGLKICSSLRCFPITECSCSSTFVSHRSHLNSLTTLCWLPKEGYYQYYYYHNDKQKNEGLLLGVVHSVNRHILLFRNRKPLSFSSKNRHRPTGRTIILITDLLTVRSKFFAICQLNNRISPHKDHMILNVQYFENYRSLRGYKSTYRSLIFEILYISSNAYYKFQIMPCFGKSYCYISKTIHSFRVFRHFLLWSRDIPNMGVVQNI